MICDLINEHRMLEIFVKIITALNLLNTNTLTEKAAAGFDEYVYPKWSAVLGWMIFACCVMPIPLYFIFNYIREYRQLSATSSVC
jgi:hypothetical protein